jgi:hypothetical protein
LGGVGVDDLAVGGEWVKRAPGGSGARCPGGGFPPVESDGWGFLSERASGGP